jgi:hypothetical protein
MLGSDSRLAAMPAATARVFASRRRRTAVLAALCAVALAGCGSDSSDVTIPQSNAKALIAQLDEVQSACESDDPKAAVKSAGDFVEGVNGLPETVGTDAKDALRDAGENLERLAAKCGTERRRQGTTSEPATTSSSSTSSAPTTSTSTSTETDTTSTGTTTSSTTTSTTTRTTTSTSTSTSTSSGAGGVGGDG